MFQFFKTLQSSRGIQLQSSSFFPSFFSENVLLSSSTFVLRKVNGDTKDDTAEALLSLLLQNISKDVHSLQLSSLGRYLFQF